MNENTKSTAKKTRKIKPNIIDFIIIIAVVAAIIGITVRSGVVEQVTINNSLETARVSFLVSNVSESSGEYFSNGDAFYSSTHKCNFGTLEQFWTMPAEIYLTNEYGVLGKTTVSGDKIDVRGTMLCTGVFTADGFFLAGSNYIAPNSSVTVKSANITVSLTIMDIEKVTDTAQ